VFTQFDRVLLCFWLVSSCSSLVWTVRTDRWCTTATNFMYRSFLALPPQKQSSSYLIVWVGRRTGIRPAPFFENNIVEVWNKIPSTHVLSRSPVGGWLQSLVGLTCISLCPSTTVPFPLCLVLVWSIWCITIDLRPEEMLSVYLKHNWFYIRSEIFNSIFFYLLEFVELLTTTNSVLSIVTETC
jgi:hypothetical protein